MLPDAVIDEALSGSLDGEGKTMDVTVLFSDIRGYTDMAQDMEAAKGPKPAPTA